MVRRDVRDGDGVDVLGAGVEPTPDFCICLPVPPRCLGLVAPPSMGGLSAVTIVGLV